MITNIQLLRAAAALAVVFYHTGYLLGTGAHTDFQGVAVFFVISGFIIPRVGYKGSRDFMTHRLIRIVPIYWIATFADLSWFSSPGKVRIALMVSAAAAAFVPENMLKDLTTKSKACLWSVRTLGLLLLILAADFFARGLRGMPHSTFVLMLKSFAFIPARDINGDIHPYLGPGWTLNLEMYFYALFAFALSIHKRLAPALTALALVVIRYFYKAGISSGIYAEFYSHDYIPYFVYGMGLYYAYGFVEKIPAAILRKRAVSGAVGIVAAATAALYIFSEIWPQSFALPCGPVLVVAAALACHLVEVRLSVSWILLLGNASYVLYLFHIFFLETIRPILKTDSTIGMAVVLMISAAGAVAIHRFVEIPLLDYLRRRGSRTGSFSQAALTVK